MSFQKFGSVLFIGLVASFSTVACTASTDDSQEESVDSSADELRASWTTCAKDSDCVAIPVGGCCPSGKKIATNKSSDDDYARAHKCTNPPTACPLFLILDQRVAQCDTGKNKCVLTKPEDIRCGGFTRNPHHCPTGYSCDLSGHVPDVPGTCVKDPPPGDCRTSSCGTGRYCSYCWGHFACIPNGALC